MVEISITRSSKQDFKMLKKMPSGCLEIPIYKPETAHTKV